MVSYHPLTLSLNRYPHGAAPVAGADGRWGNWHKIEGGVSREEAVARFRTDLLSDWGMSRAVRANLKGEILGCWCAPKACHAYSLAEVANCSDEHLCWLCG